MIITLKGFANGLNSTTQDATMGAPLGRRTSKVQDVRYSKVGMWGVLLCSNGLAISGLVLCIVSAFRDSSLSVFAGVLILLIGNYVAISAVKEKASLDLIAVQFRDLSAETRDEIVGGLIKENARSTSGILGLIEMVMNVVFKKGVQ